MVEESRRAALADILTYEFQKKKQKKEMKSSPPPLSLPTREIEQACALHFDGAYKRKEGKAVAAILIFNPLKEKVMEKGLKLLNVSSTMRLSMQLYLHDYIGVLLMMSIAWMFTIVPC